MVKNEISVMGTYDTSFEPFLTVKNEYRTYFSRKLEKNFFFRLFWQKIPPLFPPWGWKIEKISNFDFGLREQILRSVFYRVFKYLDHFELFSIKIAFFQLFLSKILIRFYLSRLQILKRKFFDPYFPEIF